LWWSTRGESAVKARCRWRGKGDFDLNGMVYNPGTGETLRILAGDGVEAIGADAARRIWVSYFDEGVFGNCGWRLGEGPDPVGAAGLNCFDRGGDILWRAQEAGIADCYALNVGRGGVHFYYYMDFRPGTVGEGFSVTYRDPELEGCHAVAVDGDGALFSAQYDERDDVVTLVGFGGGKARRRRMRAPGGGRSGPGRWIGRGSVMHFIGKTGWFRIAMRDMREAVKRGRI
jgi:hypothetical protein